MTNFRKTVVTFVLRLYLFLKDSIATLARILRSTQPSAPRTYSVGSDGSIRTLRPLTDTVLQVTNEVPRLTLPEWVYRKKGIYFLPLGSCTTAQSVEYWSFKKKDATTSSSETRGEYLDVLIPSPVGNLEQAPTLIDDATDSGVGPE